MRPANVLAIILALFPVSALAAPFSWDNPGGGDFDNIFNWNPFGVPGAGDTAAFDELGNYTVTHDGDFTNQSMTVTNAGSVLFAADVDTGRTYTLSGDADIQGVNLAVGAFQLPMYLDVGNDLKIGSGGSVVVDSESSVTTQNLLVGNLAAGGNGGIVVSLRSEFHVTGGGQTIVGGNGFIGDITVANLGTLDIAGSLELASDSDPGSTGQLFATTDAAVTVGDVEVGGGAIGSTGAITVSTGATVDLTGAATLDVGGVTGQGTGTIKVEDDSQMSTGTGLTTILDSGLVDLDDTAMFTTNGNLLVDEGLIQGEAATQFIVGPGTTTTVQNSGEISLSGNWAIEGSGGSRDVVVDSAALVVVSDELSLGNAGNSAATFTINAGNVQVGNVVIGPQGHLDLAGGTLGINVGDLDVLGGQFTADSSYTFGGFTDVSVTGNGLLSVAGTATIQKSLTVNGGSFIADDLSVDPAASFTFTSGLVQLNNGLTIGNSDVFGANLTLTPNRQLKTGTTTTIDPFSTLTLDGGLLETGLFVNNGTFDFQRGFLRITRPGGLSIGTGGALTANVTLPSDAVLDITNTATIASDGRLELGGGKLSANLAQINGIVSGFGEIEAPVNLATSGEIRVGAAQQLRITGGSSTNQGKIEVLGGEIEFTSNLSSTGTGLITGRDAIFRFQGGLDNTASVGISFGTTDVFGDVTNQNGATIAASGNSNVTFFDDVENDGDIQVSTGSSAVYFGAVTGTGNFPGGGTNFFEGDLRPGASPAEIDFGGDVVFGAGATLEAELGGTTPGTEFDVLDVLGDVTLGGTLDVSLLNPFTLSAGQSFEIIDVGGTLSGTFLDLAEGGLVGEFNGFNLLITYTAGDGNDVALLSALPGDFDIDGDVDGYDFLAWQRGESPDPLSQADLAAWEANYGTVAALSAASAVVPEPTSLALLSACGLLGLRVSRRATVISI